MGTNLRFDRDGPIGWLRLNRPDRLNAQTVAMWEELRELQLELRAVHPPLHCLIVSGEGRAFSTGLDLDEVAEVDGALCPSTVRVDVNGRLTALIGRAQSAFRLLHDAPFPTIAAVEGYALGAGLQLALACDLRVIERTASVGLLEVRLGLLPDLGATAWLPAVIGEGRAKELMFLGETIDGEEAYRIGLANAVVEPGAALSHARELAHKLCSYPPSGIRQAKESIHAGAEAGCESSLARAATGQLECFASEAFAIAARSTAAANGNGRRSTSRQG